MSVPKCLDQRDHAIGDLWPVPGRDGFDIIAICPVCALRLGVRMDASGTATIEVLEDAPALHAARAAG